MSLSFIIIKSFFISLYQHHFNICISFYWTIPCNIIPAYTNRRLTKARIQSSSESANFKISFIDLPFPFMTILFFLQSPASYKSSRIATFSSIADKIRISCLFFSNNFTINFSPIHFYLDHFPFFSFFILQSLAICPLVPHL
jgi:hypothetical protein